MSDLIPEAKRIISLSQVDKFILSLCGRLELISSFQYVDIPFVNTLHDLDQTERSSVVEILKSRGYCCKMTKEILIENNQKQVESWRLVVALSEDDLDQSQCE